MARPVLEVVDETPRHEQAELRALPAHERLRADELFRREVVFRLVPDGEFLPVKRLGRELVEVLVPEEPVVHGLVEEDEGQIVLPGVVEAREALAQELGGIGRVRPMDGQEAHVVAHARHDVTERDGGEMA